MDWPQQGLRYKRAGTTEIAALKNLQQQKTLITNFCTVHQQQIISQPTSYKNTY